jgi:hypothetical protein
MLGLQTGPGGSESSDSPANQAKSNQIEIKIEIKFRIRGTLDGPVPDTEGDWGNKRVFFVCPCPFVVSS